MKKDNLVIFPKNLSSNNKKNFLLNDTKIDWNEIAVENDESFISIVKLFANKLVGYTKEDNSIKQLVFIESENKLNFEITEFSVLDNEPKISERFSTNGIIGWSKLLEEIGIEEMSENER